MRYRHQIVQVDVDEHVRITVLAAESGNDMFKNLNLNLSEDPS